MDDSQFVKSWNSIFCFPPFIVCSLMIQFKMVHLFWDPITSEENMYWNKSWRNRDCWFLLNIFCCRLFFSSQLDKNNKTPDICIILLRFYFSYRLLFVLKLMLYWLLKWFERGKFYPKKVIHKKLSTNKSRN